MLKIFNSRARNELLKQNASASADAKKATSLTIQAKVFRNDGGVEAQRIVSYGHRNLFIHAIGAPLAYLNGAFWNWYYTRNRRNRT
jgi:hypothetical protein